MLSAQVLLTFFDMSARTHYLNARQTLRKLLDWRVVPVINENDTTTTDEISFGDNDFLAAQVAILLSADLLVLLTDTEGLYNADPRSHPEPPGARGDGLRGAGGAGDRPHHLAAGLGRDALQGGGRRDGHRGRDPTVICSGLAPGTLAAAWPGRRGNRLPRPRGALLHLQAVAEVRQAQPRQVIVDAGAARALRRAEPACCRWASSTSGDVRGRRRGRDAPRGRGRWARASPTTPPRNCGWSRA